MANEGREYKYQADITVGGQMFHVRCDTWEEFEEACANIGISSTVVTAKATVAVETPKAPYSAAPYPTPEADQPCKTCGAPTLPEKRIVGKDGRAWWVRDCSTGDKTHKGPIRPAS